MFFLGFYFYSILVSVLHSGMIALIWGGVMICSPSVDYGGLYVYCLTDSYSVLGVIHWDLTLHFIHVVISCKHTHCRVVGTCSFV